MFAKIKSIQLDDSSSWRDKIFLTFDIDWCSDEVLSYTLDIVEKYSINSTFFVTHETKLLERMRKVPNIELGIHPNFNPLLNGDFRYGKNITEVVRYYKALVPDAISVRSHSLTSNSPISEVFKNEGLLYECNQIIPEISDIEAKPYRHWEGNLTVVPHFWEDDVHCIYENSWSADRYLNYKGIKVFDFHPIHIFLNSDNLDRYNGARRYFREFERLQEHKNIKGRGAENMLMDIIKKGEIDG